MGAGLRVLIVEDQSSDAELMAIELRQGKLPFTSRRVDNEVDFLREIEEFHPDLILSDFSLPHFSGLAALDLAQEKCPEVPFILVSGAIGEEMAIDIVKHGATDYVLKDRLERLAPAVKRSLREAAEHRQRELAEAALRQSEERYHNLFKYANIGIFQSSFSGQFIQVNSAFASILGYDSPEKVLKSIHDIKAQLYAEPSHRDEILEFVLRSQGPINFEGSFYRKDGEVWQGYVFMRVVLSERGEPLYLEGYVEDITERKRAEAALGETNETLRATLQASPVAINLIDTKGIVKVWNRAAEEMFGWQAEEVLGKPLPHIPLGHEEEIKIILDEEAQGKPHIGLETQRCKKDGSVIDVSLSTAPVWDAQGKVTGAVGVLEDIGQRKRAVKELAESERRYRKLVELSPDAIYTQCEGKFVYINPAGVKLLGASCLEDLLGRAVLDFIHPDYREIVAERIGQVRRQNLVPCIEEKYLRLDGTTVDVEVAATPSIYNDCPAAQVIARDISERKRNEEQKKRLESQLHQSQKLEAIGTLAGGIAHDFNNILGVIIGYSELAIIDPAEAETNIKEVLKAAGRARDLIKQILAFSRHLEQECQPLQLYPVISEALKFLRASIPTTIEIRHYIDPDCGLIVADPVQIQQILMNLCTNAYQAMQGKGDLLEVRVESVIIDSIFKFAHPELPSGKYVRLTVSDNGPGMDQATLERIFEPFFTTKEVGKGTGLGLSVVHGIIESMGGAIYVQSAPNKGATFQVYFPQVKEVLREEVRVAGPIPHGKGHILFVDDEAPISRMAQRSLEYLGYRVTALNDSLAALNAFKAQPNEFDLVITDLSMPKMSGIKLSEKLLRLCPNLPIILCTGLGESLNLETAEGSGIREIVKKPWKIQDIGEAVRRVLTSFEAKNIAYHK
jgi:PAS domain S-box-containing protein